MQKDKGKHFGITMSNGNRNNTNTKKIDFLRQNYGEIQSAIQNLEDLLVGGSEIMIDRQQLLSQLSTRISDLDILDSGEGGSV